MKPMNKAFRKKLLKSLTDEGFHHWIIKKLIQEWNHPTPHFYGDGPHRYDGKSKECLYCGRPKNWTEHSPNYASEVLYGDAE